jgi:hypothetical protein
MNLVKELAPGQLAAFPGLFKGVHTVAGVNFTRQVWVQGYTDLQDGTQNPVIVTATAVATDGVTWQIDLHLVPSAFGGGALVGGPDGPLVLAVQNKGTQRATISVLTEET